MDSAKLYDLPDAPVPIGIAASGGASADSPPSTATSW